MLFSRVISLGSVLAFSHATPILKGPSKVVARQGPPAPSPFPLGDQCGHEWQYLNFNPSDDTDKSRLQKLHDVICSGEMRAISSYGQSAATNNYPSYKRYFPANDEEDDYQAKVSDVLRKVAGESSTDGSVGQIVASFIVDNHDFDNDCPAGTWAYTNTDAADNREKIHFCDASYNLPSAGDVNCGSLDPYPSEKFDSFVRVALHEMTHYSTMGPHSLLGDQIIDAKNDDGEVAYGPSRTHALVEENPGLCEINADSYAWMSLDTWISLHCSNGADGWQNYFTQNPPPY